VRFRSGDRVVVAEPLPSTPHRCLKGSHGTVEKRGRDDDGVWVKLDTRPSSLYFGDFELEHESVVDRLARLA